MVHAIERLVFLAPCLSERPFFGASDDHCVGQWPVFEEDKTRIDRDTWVSAVSYPAEVRDDQHDPTYLGDPHPAHLRDGPGFLEAPREPRSLSLYSLTGHYQPLQCISCFELFIWSSVSRLDAAGALSASLFVAKPFQMPCGAKV